MSRYCPTVTAGAEVAVMVPFVTLSVLSALSKSHGSNVSTSCTCGPVPAGYVLVVTVKIQEPNTLVPVALPPAEDRVNVVAWLVNVGGVGLLARPRRKPTPPG